jgi:ferredoxin--NADP+ reductase
LNKFQRSKVKLSESKILRRVDLTEDLWLIWIEKPVGFAFKPGQYCTIGAGGIERAYSIVSAPHEDSIELFVELVPLPEGQLTPLLWDLKPGDSVTIRPRAKGIFTLKPSFPNQVFISTVTGVVPYVSILRDFLYRIPESNNKFYLLHGASYTDEFGYYDELMKLSTDCPEIINFVPTVSRPSESRNKDWEGEVGRVNTLVESFVDKLELMPSDTLIYACGHPEMIEDVKERMIPKGYKVEEERFWKPD